MASSTSITLVTVALLVLAAAQPARACYTRLFSFGDSLADTGNCRFIFSNQSDAGEPALRPPYGETFFHNATGRFSNGRLIIDFIGTAQHSHQFLVDRPISLLSMSTNVDICMGAPAEALGLPFVPPYLGGVGQSAEYFAVGANFAVGGATALSPEFFQENGAPVANHAMVGLDMEMDWFRHLLKLLCANDLDGISPFSFRILTCSFPLRPFQSIK
jgi:phospholipase/lecithinase/hemolysin